MNNLILFGTSYDPKQLKKILLSLIAMFVYVMMMMGLVRKMPALVSGIAKSTALQITDSFGQPGMGGFRQNARQAINNAGTGLGVIGGGWLGSQAGKALGGARSRSLGAWVGAAYGGNAGGKMGDKLSEQIGLLAGRR